ncbi:MAG TPA: hypothetical protein VLE51_01185 [Candidatus Saccharimonadales bacterium]|nr:hypothetical protein [Candidatus Saccharimonadales bacterium]
MKLKIKTLPARHLRLLALFFCLALLFLFGAAFRAHADTIVRGFKSDTAIDPGFIVALKIKDSNSVVVNPANNANRLYGVVIDPSTAPFTVQLKADQQVFVATSGAYPALVSSQNGTIRAGDYISISNTAGIGVKAASDQAFTLGVALEKFDGRNGVLTHTSDGSSIGRINVQITVGKNPLAKDETKLPKPLKSLGDSIAGKSVSVLRVYSALAIFAVTFAVAAILLMGGIRSSIVAIGRNPLSRQSIYKGLARVIAVSILVFIAGLFGIYLLLRI